MKEMLASSERPVIWFEVEDLIRHFDWASHAGGIQRVSLELLRASHELQPDDIKFCRLSQFNGKCYKLDFHTIQKTCGDHQIIRRFPIKWEKLSPAVAVICKVLCLLTRRSIAWLKDWAWPSSRQAKFKRSDFIVVIGSAWDNSSYVKVLTALLERHELRLIVLIHDIIPLTCPEFVPRRRIGQFRNWFEEIIPLSSLLLTSSNYCRSEIQRWCEVQKLRVCQIELIRFGDGFTHGRDLRAATLDLPKWFVLFVSTIEIRKNHQLLVRLWEQMIAKHGAANVPHLVWVGDRGWLVDDLFAELEANRYLDGKITILSDLPDTALRDVYQRCAFSIYPSLCEGWGLPVAESLSLGKYCIASNRTSLPEVAGSLIDYFDPSSEDESLELLERAIFEPEYLAARTLQVQRDYRPARWGDCVRTIMRHAAMVA